jgi:hypothetical protein
MSELTTDHGPKPRRDKARMVADGVVTASSLATHLGMTRQNVARLTAAAVIEQRVGRTRTKTEALKPKP